MNANPLQSDLLSNPSIEKVFQKHIIDGTSYFFSSVVNDIDLEYDLRTQLADDLEVELNDLVLVGSAKLGYSIKTHKFESFDNQFTVTGNKTKKSDIDFAVVSKPLFDRTAKEIFNLSKHHDKTWADENWKMNPFTKGEEKNLYHAYIRYLSRGWLRPDTFPNDYLSSCRWISTCSNIRTKLNRNLSIAIYSDWFYFKTYQIDQLQRLKSLLEQGN